MTNFYSIQFLIFLVLSLISYYTAFRKKQWVCLLIVSGVFYYWTGINNFFFLFITGVTTWVGAQWIEKYSTELVQLRKDKTTDKAKQERIIRKRRTVMWGVVLVNFGMLAYIKYIPVMITNISGILLPLGISFYIFQSIGYLLDVYNGKYESQKNFWKYMLFIGYFPQMIQGPINRYDMLGGQFEEIHRWNGQNATKAVYRIGYGLLKKYAIANVFAGAIASVFDYPVKDYSGAIVLFAILLYSAQQYADFSGGMDMVLGVSELFGIQMTENFKQPYFATSLADFWRRWHISLGKWMRDYVFYPFALTRPMKKFGKWSNKKLGKHLGRVLPAAIGNILVFFIVGIWHGAEMHYVIWGLYNGLVIAFSDIMSPVYAKFTEILHLNTKTLVYRIFQSVRTFIIVNIGWYFDRITDIRVALYSLKKTIFHFNIELFETERNIIFDGYPRYILKLAIVSCLLVGAVSIMSERKIDVRRKLSECSLVIRWGIYLFVIGIILFANTVKMSAGGFMYANF